MQNGTNGNKFNAVLLFLFIVFSSFTGSVYAQPAKSVAILPFEVMSSKDLAYLKEGVRVMLSSRLAAGAGVNVVDRSTVDRALAGNKASLTQDMAVKLGKQLGADYLITGNLTAMGGLSLDAKVYNVTDGDVLNFFVTAEKEDEVIKAVDQLAWDVAGTVFGVAVPSKNLAVPVAAAPVLAPDQNQHPDRAFSAPMVPVPAVAPVIGKTTAHGFTKSRDFKIDLQAMDLADVDGDGVQDVILCGRHEVSIFRIIAGQMQQIGFFKNSPKYKIHGVTTADLNNNGRAEIYLSAADYIQPNSMVVEWDGKDFSPIAEDIDWYIRVVTTPVEGKVLLGQKSGSRSPIVGGLFRLSLENGVISQVGSFSVPDNVNLFDFSMGDINGDGISEFVSVDENDRLRVWNVGGRMLWQSDEHYGGTTRFVGGSPDFENQSPIEDPEEGKRIYIPSSIYIHDINNDNINEVLVIKNLASASRVFEKWKKYPSGEVHALAWNGLGLSGLWQTDKLDGYTADLVFMADKDKQDNKLLIGLVIGSGSDRTTLLTFPIDIKNKASN